MKHIRGAPMHPQTQGKIERWHQTLKNRIPLENYFLKGDLEAAIAAFIDHYKTTATTRTSATSPRPMSILAVAKPFWPIGDASN